jgi:hypothetical protein
MPQTLHAQLAARSDAEGVSLNQYIVEALSRALSNPPEATESTRPVPRSLRLSLLANAIVVALAAATCVAILLVAWR